MPKSVSRAIFFNVPDRSEDLIIKENEEFVPFVSTQSAILDEEVSGLEYSSREYFLPEYKISSSKLNTIRPLKNKSTLLGYQDGSVYEIRMSDQHSGLSNSSALEVRKFADGNTPVLAMAESPDGKYLAVSQFSVVSIVDLEDRKLIAQLHRVKGRILELAWSPDSSQLLMGRANGDVFAWTLEDDVYYTQDSLDVLDLYETQASPVVGISFHPSGRAFFVALENGALFLVRLLRTEVELGLIEADTDNQIGKGTYVQGFGNTAGGASSFFILPEKDELLVVSLNGSAVRWRIRGLKQLEVIDIGSEASTFSSFVDRSIGNLGSDLIVGVGRSLRLKVSCLKRDYKRLLAPTNEVYMPENGSVEDNGGGTGPSQALSDDQALLNELNSEIKKVGQVKNAAFSGGGKDFNLVLETAKFKESISVLTFAPETGVLWVGGKSGMLSGFYLRSYLEVSGNLNRIDAICK